MKISLSLRERAAIQVALTEIPWPSGDGTIALFALESTLHLDDVPKGLDVATMDNDATEFDVPEGLAELKAVLFAPQFKAPFVRIIAPVMAKLKATVGA